MVKLETDTKRPIWKHKEMSEKDFRKIYEFGWIHQIKAEREVISVDRSETYLVATNSEGDCMRLPQGSYGENAPGHYKNVMDFQGEYGFGGLFDFNYVGKKMIETIEAMDAFDKEHEKDLEEFKRLQEKFGGR